MRGWLHLPVLVVSNKSDLSDYGGADMTMSTQSGAGVAEVLDRMVEMLGEVDKEEGESREE